MSRVVSCTVVLVLVVAPSVFADEVIYSSDFENGVVDPEWGSTGTLVVSQSPSPIFEHFLGEDPVQGLNNGLVTLSLSGIPPHNHVTVSFDLYIIDSWDGNADHGSDPDIWGLLHSGDVTLLRTTFCNHDESDQAYPDGYPGGVNVFRTGASATNTLGYPVPYGDSTYTFPNNDHKFTFLHTDDTLNLIFYAEQMQAVSDESWGLDNVTVTILDPIPTVSEWGLVVMAILVLAVGCVVMRRSQRQAA